MVGLTLPSPEALAKLVERLNTIAGPCKCPASEAAAAIVALEGENKRLKAAARETLLEGWNRHD